MSTLAVTPGVILPRIARTVRRAPLTTTLITILLATTVVLQHLSNDEAALRWASTNVDNLTTAPVRSLLASATVLPGGNWLFYAVVLACSLGVLERRFGSLRAIGIFASAHVLATVLTEGGVWLGVQMGDVPGSAQAQIDVGVSYGMWACVGAVVVLLPRRWRLPAALTLSLFVLAPVLSAYDMTAAGHLLSFAIGLAWWPYLLRRLRPARTTARSAAEYPAGDPTQPLAR